MQRVFDARLFFLQFRFRRGADLHLRHAARELRLALVQLFAVVIGSGQLNFGLNLLDAALNRFARTGTFDDRRVVCVDDDLLRLTEVLDRHVLQIDADVLHHGRRTGQHRNVFQHRLAAVAITRRLHRTNVQNPAQLVDHQGGQCFAFDVFRNNQQRALRLRHLLQQRNQLRHTADLVFMDEHERLAHVAGHGVLISHKVRREEPAIKLHALHHLDDRLAALALFNRNHAVLADLVKTIGQQLANHFIVIRRNLRDVHDVITLVRLHRTRHFLQRRHYRTHALRDAAIQRVAVRTGRKVSQAVPENRFRQNRRRRRAVARHRTGLARRFLDQLSAEILVLVDEFDFLGHGYAVFGDVRTAPALINDRIAATRSQGGFHRRRQFLHTRP